MSFFCQLKKCKNFKRFLTKCKENMLIILHSQKGCLRQPFARPLGVGGIKVVGLLEIKQKSFGRTHRHIRTNKQTDRLAHYYIDDIDTVQLCKPLLCSYILQKVMPIRLHYFTLDCGLNKGNKSMHEKFMCANMKAYFRFRSKQSKCQPQPLRTLC